MPPVIKPISAAIPKTKSQKISESWKDPVYRAKKTGSGVFRKTNNTIMVAAMNPDRLKRRYRET